jgi:hypothetical protein
MPASAALEDWTCHGIADYYGFVAIDRDNGMALKDRVNATVKAIITVMDSRGAAENIDSDDAQVLVQIVYRIYEMRGTAYDIRRDALLKCMGGKLHG